MNSYSLKSFVGKRINESYIDADKSTMYWQVDNEWYSLVAEGDCCSYSWYEHCDNGAALQDAKVLEYESCSGDSKEDD
jgi:hypothetical protein